jgi:hypothetical protein
MTSHRLLPSKFPIATSSLPRRNAPSVTAISGKVSQWAISTGADEALHPGRAKKQIRVI